ncbi:UDP-N-acetylmuramate dehydrogenase [Candidatus Riesia pediculischaeffi]|uniref:UDP-N-acetylenolpyruvoylglucosamine reductase n=1 Tax=Candidatus Riesia pediculischaeffi PTSU TaxID=1401651 RepID=A0A0C1S9Y2_9ENTR|nr:UDP-N-acetylmuramate dehydrogenase [Candidatus Riesia pediculischaeffi]KIE64116.1 UDP-N-acetylenolpyruvoylglucosamine reductase [Candidatus Riesia pediculischaeffi PTSU]
MKIYTTFGISAKAKLVYKFDSIDQLKLIWNLAKNKSYPFLVLGNRSKTIFIDKFSGIIALNHIKALKIKECKDHHLIHVGSGNNWSDLVKMLLNMEIYGLENLSFIPGSVGAAAIQNMGAYGIEFKDICEYVDTIDLSDGKIKRFYKEECQFKYRESIFKDIKYKKFVVVSVCLKVSKIWKPILRHEKLMRQFQNNVKIKDIINFIFKERSQRIPNPSVFGNVGSFFKNPTVSQEISGKIKKKFPEYRPSYFIVKNKVHAGWLIKRCKLQGKKIGGTEVYRNNPSILINHGYSIGKDVMRLSRYIICKVFKKFGISLEKEAILVGKYGEIN